MPKPKDEGAEARIIKTLEKLKLNIARLEGLKAMIGKLIKDRQDHNLN